MKTKTFKYLFFFTVSSLFLSIILTSCLEKQPYNPFDREETIDTLSTSHLDPTSFEGLYENVFKPNCSTSGCHDGSFDPDFRSIESSFNTLVWSDVISNDPTTPSDFRVKPNDADNSMLIRRILTFIPNSSGVMPLEVNPDSDWSTKKDDYIQNLKDWINDGAKDIFGNISEYINLKPQLTGFIVTPSGSNTPFPRNVKGVIQIPSTETDIDLYIGIGDNEISPADLSVNELQLSLSRDDFSQADSYNMSIISPISENGYIGNTNYYHKVSIQSIDTLWLENQKVFIKAIVNDGVNIDSDLPGINTLDHLKNYYSFERVL